MNGPREFVLIDLKWQQCCALTGHVQSIGQAPEEAGVQSVDPASSRTGVC